ncbi:hypothetical protein KP509_02G099200 [Ceratopteris richardii]|uniref:Clp R domain-containing protein n=1 Tax=Ceratopteris richardii TaxID=49495 RepID=A0A8T2V928_CERRI|nr:hypothetical protein KP509_02G099200 [Ceratopteris richardii]KAH7444950.1 hypothetical protein KP509_02G099200 [Ceratopteris richardii]
MAPCASATSSLAMSNVAGHFQAAPHYSLAFASTLESSRHGMLSLSYSVRDLSLLRFCSFPSSNTLRSLLPSQMHPTYGRERYSLSPRMMLPSEYPDRVASPERPKWSARAIKTFSMAELEARKLKYPTTGTEALLMGMLTEGTSQAARYLRAHGITLFGVRDETIRLLGKSDMYFFSPEHPPLTEPAQKALDWAVDEKKKSGTEGEVTATHLLLGIWAQKGSAGQQVLAALGFDEKNAAELQETLKEALPMS